MKLTKIMKTKTSTALCGLITGLLMLAAQPASAQGTLYGVNGALDQLVTIDTTTGAASPVGGPLGGSVLGIDFAPSGTLYGVDRASDTLVTIDTTTGAASPVGPLGLRGVNILGLSHSAFNVNDAPTAVAGLDQSIRAGATVNLDGSASFDDNTDSALLEYSWSFFSKPAGSIAILLDDTTATPSFVADVAGSYVVDLVVTDEQGADSVLDSIIISSDNQAPTAVATVDFGLAIIGTTSNFDGTGSTDPELDLLTYSWAITTAPVGSTATLGGANTGNPTLSTDVAGTYELTLTVSDFLGAGTPASVEVVATTPGNYAEIQIVYACDAVEALTSSQVTTKGNQKAFCNFLKQATKDIHKGKISNAIGKLNQALERTDGCALRGSPDGNGSGMDWITDCAAQEDVYALLTSAIDALQL